jgi:hypothetical protein
MIRMKILRVFQQQDGAIRVYRRKTEEAGRV